MRCRRLDAEGSDEQDPGADLPAETDSVDPTEVLDPETRQAVQAMITGTVVESFSSPFPPPRILDDYNHALPDGAERVVGMAERQAAHRQGLENRGQLFGFAFAMVALLGGIGLIAAGQPVEGLVALISALAGVGGLFIYSEVQSHRRQLPPPPSDADATPPAAP